MRTGRVLITSTSSDALTRLGNVSFPLSISITHENTNSDIRFVSLQLTHRQNYVPCTWLGIYLAEMEVLVYCAEAFFQTLVL